MDVRISFLLNILRRNGQNLTKFCIHINIDKILAWINHHCLAHLSRRLIGELIVYEGIRRPSLVRLSTFSNYIASEAMRPILCHISHIASIGRGNEKLCFLFQSDKNSGCYGNL